MKHLVLLLSVMGTISVLAGCGSSDRRTEVDASTEPPMDAGVDASADAGSDAGEEDAGACLASGAACTDPNECCSVVCVHRLGAASTCQ